MNLDAKPTETEIVLVHDKILMALLGAKGIKSVHTFLTGWPDGLPEFQREVYMAYEQTSNVKQLIQDFEERKVSVNLDDYLVSAMELEHYIGDIDYIPRYMESTVNEHK